jgi:hypothetical protein
VSLVCIEVTWLEQSGTELARLLIGQPAALQRKHADFASDALVSDEPKEPLWVPADLARDLPREAQYWL